MGSSLHFLKTILLPLLISLTLYLTLNYALLPLYRRHRARYAHYLPLPLSALSTQTSSVPSRLWQTLTSFLLPSSWQRRWDGRRGSDSEDDGLFDDEEGEGMVGFEVDEGRREALEREVRGERGVRDEGRLSRDLEVGFRDDSDEEREVGG